MLGSLILYFKGMRILMFQLSGFYYRVSVSSTSQRLPKCSVRADRTGAKGLIQLYSTAMAWGLWL